MNGAVGILLAAALLGSSAAAAPGGGGREANLRLPLGRQLVRPAWRGKEPVPNKLIWPRGKRFAFSVLDDTDLATVANVGPVYRFLYEQGLRTTKTCWTVRGDPNRGRLPGQTCDDPEYLVWLQELQGQGFEIGWHNATWHGLPRPQTLAALEKFAAHFGSYPRTAANHTGVEEGMYWAAARLTGLHALAYNLLTRFSNTRKYQGHLEDSPFFWGDACREKITYFRNFIFRGINTLQACPFMPYHDPLRPYVNSWFASSDGHDLDAFNQCLAEDEQDRLENEQGACIMYVHFAKGFCEGGRLNPRFKLLVQRLSEKNGWFVPVATLLDYLRAQHGTHEITAAERRSLERRWLLEKILVGTS
jgi:hypothetical protein